jgi:hypothetical protein
MESFYHVRTERLYNPVNPNTTVGTADGGLTSHCWTNGNLCIPLLRVVFYQLNFHRAAFTQNPLTLNPLILFDNATFLKQHQTLRKVIASQCYQQERITQDDQLVSHQSKETRRLVLLSNPLSVAASISTGTDLSSREHGRIYCQRLQQCLSQHCPAGREIEDTGYDLLPRTLICRLNQHCTRTPSLQGQSRNALLLRRSTLAKKAAVQAVYSILGVHESATIRKLAELLDPEQDRILLSIDLSSLLVLSKSRSQRSLFNV